MEEFDREVKWIKMETAESYEGRLQMERALLESEDKYVCMRANVKLALGRVASMERENRGIAMRLEDLTVGNKRDRDGLLGEIHNLRVRNQTLKTALIERKSEGEILARCREDVPRIAPLSNRANGGHGARNIDRRGGGGGGVWKNLGRIGSRVQGGQDAEAPPRRENN